MKKDNKKSTNNRQSPKKSISTDAEAIRAQRIKNLTPGGPGRPKGKLNYDTRVDMAVEVLARKYVEDFNKKKENKNKQITLEDVDIEGDIFAQHLNKARNGNDRMIDSFLDRRHGKATQKVELSGKDGGPVTYAMKMAEVDAETDEWFKTWTKGKEELDNKKQDDKTTGPKN